MMLASALFLTTLTNATEEGLPVSSLSSEKISYDGNHLMMTGNVQIKHALGKISSGSARLEKENKDDPFSHMHLKDGVYISLKNRGKISCGSADFDFIHMTGLLHPNKGEKVTFVNPLAGPLLLSSNSFTIGMERKADSVKVAKIETEDRVFIQYGKDFLLEADKATYTQSSCPHVIAAPNCKITHLSDSVEAAYSEIYPDASKIILYKTAGTLGTFAISKGGGINFSCKQLVWEKTPQTITMQGDIIIQDAGIGKILCDEEIEIKQRQIRGRWSLSTITSKGKTELNYLPGHFVTSYGKMQLDQERLTLTVDTSDDKGVEYSYDQMHIVGKSAKLNYTKGGSCLEPEELLLFGDVRLSSSEDNTRVALADQFAFFPKEKKVILSAKESENVLFFDESEDLCISAKEIHITKTEKGESVKGVGNVRFAFSSAESTLLKKFFPFYRGNR